MRTRFVFALVTLAACNPTPAAIDAAPSTPDTNVVPTDTNPPDPDVTACQNVVDQVIAACVSEGGDAERECLYAAYRSLCSQGRTRVVTAMMNCLLMDACQSAADPSGATICVQGVVSANQDAAHLALGAAVCNCETASPETGCPTFPQNSGAELIMGSDADATTVTTCLAGMTSCTDPTSCYQMIPFGAAFTACLSM